jgi:hypothetical protein
MTIADMEEKMAQQRVEIADLRASLKGAEIALARDGDVEGAMRCILSGTSAWQPISGVIERKVLVTNNIDGRNARGDMSHVWCVDMVHDTDPKHGYSAFDDGDRRLWGLTHFAEIPK